MSLGVNTLDCQLDARLGQIDVAELAKNADAQNIADGVVEGAGALENVVPLCQSLAFKQARLRAAYAFVFSCFFISASNFFLRAMNQATIPPRDDAQRERQGDRIRRHQPQTYIWRQRHP